MVFLMLLTPLFKRLLYGGAGKGSLGGRFSSSLYGAYGDGETTIFLMIVRNL